MASVAVDLFKSSLPLHPSRILRIIKARKEINQAYAAGNVKGIYQVYNEEIIKGTPAPLILRAVERYARQRQTQDKLDYRILRPLAERHEAGKTTGILSAGYRYGIQMILKAAGYESCFDFYEANLLRENDGKAIEIEQSIFTNKAPLLLRLLKERDLDAKRVAYIGDSEDDAACFEIVGYPVVAFLARDELKKNFAQRYKAFVPDNEEDLTKYLKAI